MTGTELLLMVSIFVAVLVGLVVLLHLRLRKIDAGMGGVLPRRFRNRPIIDRTLKREGRNSAVTKDQYMVEVTVEVTLAVMWPDRLPAGEGEARHRPIDEVLIEALRREIGSRNLEKLAFQRTTLERNLTRRDDIEAMCRKFGLAVVELRLPRLALTPAESAFDPHNPFDRIGLDKLQALQRSVPDWLAGLGR